MAASGDAQVLRLANTRCISGCWGELTEADRAFAIVFEALCDYCGLAGALVSTDATTI